MPTPRAMDPSFPMSCSPLLRGRARIALALVLACSASPLLAQAPGPAAAPVAAAAPAASAGTALDDLTRLLVFGTPEESRRKELLDWLLDRDNAASQRQTVRPAIRERRPDPAAPAQDARQDLETRAAQDDNATLALFNSLGLLGVQVHVDRQSPLFKRDLSGSATVGDGRMPVSVLLVDASTRTPGRRLSQQAALTLSLGTDPAKPTADPRDYLAQLRDKLQAVLREKEVRIVEPASRGRGGQSLDILTVDLADRQNSIDRIGRSFGYTPAPALIVVFDALARPEAAPDLLMFRHDESAARLQRTRDGWAAQLRELQQRLAEPRFERVASLSLPELIEHKAGRLQAERAAADRNRQEMRDRLARIKAAASGDGDLAGALRVYRRDKPLPAIRPETAYCSVKAQDPLPVQGLTLAPAFQSFSGIPRGTRFSQVFDTPDALYSALLDGKCLIVVDLARHLDRYLAALVRDQAHFINVGPVMSRQEAREPYAQALGYDSADDLELADKLNPVRVTPAELKALRAFGVPGQAEYAEVRRRMGQQKYGGGAEADVSEVLLFLRDEQKGRAQGVTAARYRELEDQREAAEARAREAAAQREQADRARRFPYEAVLTCGMGSRHLNILACFAAEGSYGVATELKLTRDGRSVVYKVFNLSEAGSQRGDGLHIDLTEDFALVAQNSHGTLVLGLKIVERQSGKVLYQDQVGKFGVLRVSN